MYFSEIWDFLAVAVVCFTIENIARDVVSVFKKPSVLSYKSVHYVQIEKSNPINPRIRRNSL